MEGRKASYELTAFNLRLIRNMGGGPRTFPGGVSKWKWKRMHEKRAEEKQRKLLEQEKQLYQARIRSHIRSTLSPPSSSSSSTHNPISPQEHIKALADRFMKEGAQDLWNDLDGPVAQTQTQTQTQAQISPQHDLPKLVRQPSNRNLTNYSQIRDYRSFPEVRDLTNYSQIRAYCSVSKVRGLTNRNHVSKEKPEKRRIWRNNGSSTESESEDEVESKNQGYYSNMGSIASLGKYDVKRERRVMPKPYNDETDFSEQVELIKYELNKKKLSQNEDNQGDEQKNILSQTRYYYYLFDAIEMVSFTLCVDFLFELNLVCKY